MKINNLKNILLKGIITASIVSTSVYADSNQILLENSWMNIGFSNAKDAMLSGATTATGKGYSALFTNPAGLATNYAVGLYVRSGTLEHKNATGATTEDSELAKTSEVTSADNTAIGLFYKYLVIESKKNVHNAIGLAYGFETDYGIFSLGANMVKDSTSEENYKTFGTGDYKTVGFQWQKSFIGIDKFYSFYFGFSKKGQGVKQFEDVQIYRVSPMVQRIGFGFETNIWSSTILVSLDQSTQSWKHLDDSLDTTAIGLKWMPFSGFTIALGHSTSTYNTQIDLKDNTTNSVGLEFGIWQMNVAIAALQKEVLDNAGDIYIQENSVYADVSFAF